MTPNNHEFESPGAATDAGAPPVSPTSLRGRARPAIEATKTRVPWQRGVFELARHLMPLAAGYNIAKDNPALFDEVVRDWHTAARPRATFTEVWAEFVVAWPKVKYAAGEGLFEVVVARASDQAYWPREYDEPQTNHLLAVCHELGRGVPGGVFYLSARTAMRVCGFGNAMTASTRLRVLQADGWIQLVEKHTKTRAARYRFARRVESWSDLPA
jgi:hypothetical protein